MYYDLLPKIKNAIQARKDKMVVPFSRMDFSVLNLLAENGYIKSAEKETTANGKKSVIVVRLGVKTKTAKVNDFKTMSKPSRHMYVDYRSLRSVRQGHGMAVLSTSKGIMTGKEARKQKTGGEYLFEIW
ncbi:MAG: 30S ribosomal protein S8 [Patescibacteria group bacterium]|nr:30S ribosomal protein S8 [Patescibacteria group bacterium]